MRPDLLAAGDVALLRRHYAFGFRFRFHDWREVLTVVGGPMDKIRRRSKHQNLREPGEKSDLQNLTDDTGTDRLNGSELKTNSGTGYTEWRNLA